MKPTKNAGKSVTLESYSDADFAADKADRKSLTGGVIRLNWIAVSWTAKKQGDVALFTIKAEFVAASEQAREFIGIRQMLCEFGLPPGLPITLHVDKQAAIKQLWRVVIPESQAHRCAPQVCA
ncbi:unnamed protein product [Peronospora farinosa]|uniref:Uncharacterized protein n=1 Tax=Peronospora farinosa TaxID=134698 RepID=A0AAV0U6V0_9STRA|nr:unnamed protein product [Peronospora farinosa]